MFVALKITNKNYIGKLLLILAVVNACQGLVHMQEVVDGSVSATLAPPQTHWQQTRPQRNNISRWRQTAVG